MWWNSVITPRVTTEHVDSKAALTGTAVERQIAWNNSWNR